MCSPEKGPISTRSSTTLPTPDNFANILVRQLQSVTSALDAGELESIPKSTQLDLASAWTNRTLIQDYPFSQLTNPHSQSAWELLNKAINDNQNLPPIFTVYLSKLVMGDVNIAPDYWSVSDYEQFLGMFDLSKPLTTPAHQRYFLKRTIKSMEGSCYEEIADDPLNKEIKIAETKRAAKAMCQQKLPEPVKKALSVWDESKSRNYRLQIGDQSLKFDSQDERIVGYLLAKYNLVSLVEGETLHPRINQHGAHSLDFYIPWARTFVEFHPTSATDRKLKLDATESIENRIGHLIKPHLAGAEVIHIWELDQLWDTIDYLQSIEPIPGATKPIQKKITKEKFYLHLSQAKAAFNKLKSS